MEVGEHCCEEKIKTTKSVDEEWMSIAEECRKVKREIKNKG